MNVRKEGEALKKAALQASALQRHAHHAASRLTWVERWLKRAYHHHAQSRELKRTVILVQRTRRSQGWRRNPENRAARRSTGRHASARTRPRALCHQQPIEEPFELA